MRLTGAHKPLVMLFLFFFPVVVTTCGHEAAGSAAVNKEAMRMMRTIVSYTAAVSLIPPQRETPITIEEFTVPTADSYPRSIAAGPDGSLWFTEECGNKIGKVQIHAK